jgi:hypothetical protein
MDLILQDLIRVCLEHDRKTFSLRLGVPVLVSQTLRKDRAFVRGGTTLKRDIRKERPDRQGALEAHQLQVVMLQQRVAGPSGRITVGRDKGNDVVLSDDTVSSKHAIFQRNDKTGTFILQDLASTNGTWVNSRPLTSGRSITLFDGDLIFFGDCGFYFFSPEGLYDALASKFKPV